MMKRFWIWFKKFFWEAGIFCLLILLCYGILRGTGTALLIPNSEIGGLAVVTCDKQDRPVIEWHSVTLIHGIIVGVDIKVNTDELLEVKGLNFEVTLFGYPDTLVIVPRGALQKSDWYGIDPVLSQDYPGFQAAFDSKYDLWVVQSYLYGLHRFAVTTEFCGPNKIPIDSDLIIA